MSTFNGFGQSAFEILDKHMNSYSVLPEQPYYLGKDVQLPILMFLKDDIIARYKDLLNNFVAFCKRKKFSANASTTWFYFVEDIKVNGTNLNKRRIFNLTVLLIQSIQMASESCANKEPEVVFQEKKVDEKGVVIEDEAVKGEATRESKKARYVQGCLKDIVTTRVAADPRPILDLGGGTDAIQHSLENLGFRGREIVSYDIKNSPDFSFSTLDMNKYKGYQVVMNHSSYHIPYPIFSKVLQFKPRGITLVVDGNTDEVEIRGDDYFFKAVRDYAVPEVEAFRVSGNLFGVRSTNGRGRVFSNEIWYSRRQWSKWGFNLHVDVNSRSSFVRDHIVLFDGNFEPSSSVAAISPEPVRLSEGRTVESVPRKNPPMHELFQKDREKELRTYIGQSIYQTPKLDGICMRMFCDDKRKVSVIDRMGLVYDVHTVNRNNIYLQRNSQFSLSVELVPTVETGTYVVYANQVDKNAYPFESQDALDEIKQNVFYLNKLMGRMVIGLKDYVLTRNNIIMLKTSLPHDGVVYVPAYTTTGQSELIMDVGLKPVHSFSKPFAGTDTIPHVILSESRVLGREFVVNYRSFEVDISSSKSRVTPVSPSSPFSDQLDRLIRSTSFNSTDYFGPSTVSPLMYEGYYVPKECLGTLKDSFIITHVRADKAKKAVEVQRTLNLDWLKKGVIGLTRWGANQEDVTTLFFFPINEF